jgi:hypothetical protein
MIRLVSYADGKMINALRLCAESASKQGVEQCITYQRYMVCGEPGMHEIYKEFYEFNKSVLDQERGGGYWLWKPYVIYLQMLNAKEGDILIYSDAGVEFVNPVREIIDRMDEDIFFFTNGFLNVEWCKGDVYCNILHEFPDLPFEYKDRKQVQASVIFFKVNQKTRDFVKEWLLWCQMPGFIDDSPSKLPNYPTFAEHRHDQAILTCLQIKYGYKLHFWPTKYSEHIRHTARPEDSYPTMFNHHRKRDSEW